MGCFVSCYAYIGEWKVKLLQNFFFHFLSLSAQEMPSSPYGWTSRDIIGRPGLWNWYEQLDNCERISKTWWKKILKNVEFFLLTMQVILWGIDAFLDLHWLAVMRSPVSWTLTCSLRDHHQHVKVSEEKTVEPVEICEIYISQSK